MSFSIKDGASLCGGEAIEEAVRAVVSHPMFKSGRVVAIGVNCCNPDNVTQALTAIRSVTKTTPLVVSIHVQCTYRYKIWKLIFGGLGGVVRVRCQKVSSFLPGGIGGILENIGGAKAGRMVW